MAIKLYPDAKSRFSMQTLGWADAVVYALLVKSPGAYNSSHTSLQQVLNGGAYEFSGGGYSRQPLVITSVVIDPSNIYASARAGTVTFSSLTSGISVVGVLLAFGSFVSLSNTYPVAWFDGGTSPNNLPQTTTGGNLTVTWSATDGIIKI